MTGPALTLALRNLRRDLRSGELTLILIAIVIAVAAMSTVNLFVDRVEGAMTRQGSTLLAADMVLESSDSIADAWRDAAAQRGLQHADTLSMRTMVQFAEAIQLIELKAVSAGYPLRGRTAVADTPLEAGHETDAIPQAGAIWVDARLMRELHFSMGDAIRVGNATLRVSKILTLEPDRGGDFFNIAPRALMNLDDIPSTGLIMPGSRISYRLLLAGDAVALASLRRQVEASGDINLKVREVRDARPELRAAIERADLFLGMAALIAVIVAGVAIALGARRYAERHFDMAAIMRCLGASQAVILRVLSIQLLTLAATAGLAGVAIGFAAQSLLSRALSGLITGELPPPSLHALVGGIATSIIILLGFAMTPLMSLRNVPPLRVFRRHLVPLPSRSAIIYGMALLALLAIAPWHGGNVLLVLFLLGGCIAAIAMLSVCAWLSVRLLSGSRARVGVSWRYGLSSLARRSRSSILQIVALGIGIMAMLLITRVHADLFASWQDRIPANAPNQFLINIPPAEVQALNQFLTDSGLKSGGIYPMIRGRLTHINGKAVQPLQYGDPRAQRLVEREFNLSFSRDQQMDNRIQSGRWWGTTQNPTPQFSVESGIAETLGIKLGDTLTYSIAGRSIQAPVTSLRQVQWDTFNVNFFVVASPGSLDGMPATYITSFYLPPNRQDVLIKLAERFPSVTVIDVAAVMTQVRAIMDHVRNAVRQVLVFTLLAGALVLATAMQATQEERTRESAILRALGARRSVVARALLAEFLLIGLISGLLAAAAATAIAWLLASQVFHIEYRFNAMLWPMGAIAGVLGVAAFGMVGLRSAMSEPPAAVLRRLNPA